MYQGPKRLPMSVQAYHALGRMGLIPEKTELVHGQIYRKMPKSPLHCALLLRLLWILQVRIPAGYFVRPEQPLTLADSEPEPDLSVISGSPESFLESHPTTAELVIEICVSSYDYDQEKLSAYASAVVQEVWLVLAEYRRVEVYRKPAGDHYTETLTLETGDSLTCSSVAMAAISLDELFRS